jgi:hypothetical protein
VWGVVVVFGAGLPGAFDGEPGVVGWQRARSADDPDLEGDPVCGATREHEPGEEEVRLLLIALLGRCPEPDQGLGASSNPRSGS